MVSRLIVFLLMLSGGVLQAQITFDSLASTRKQLRFTGSSTREVSLHLSPEALPIAGKWRNGAGDTLLFDPLFPLKEEHSYLLRIDGAFAGQVRLPKVKRPEPTVMKIHPASDTVPANLLKLYIVFDQPMATGHAAEYIQLIHQETGEEEAAAFLQLEQELWSYTGDTLTMWLDPGRIKRDLIPNVTMGNPLTQGARYSLRIKQGWPAQNGTTLTRDFVRQFYVGDMDRARPDPTEWIISVPQAGTTEPLKLRLAQALDMGAMVDALQLRYGNTSVPFQLSWKARDKEIWLVPENIWVTGEYILTIASRIEDLAGNRLDRLFDEEIGDQENKWTDQLTVTIK